MRGLLPAALSLSVLSFVVLVTEPTPAQPVAATAPATTSTTAAPPATTTSITVAAPPTTTPPAPRPPAPPTTAKPAAPRVTAPPVTAAPRPVATHAGRESCGWQWDALRIDDGSSNEVTMLLDAPRRPHETVTITAAFAGPDSPDASRTTTTDGAGEATAKFSVSEDKRDWTIAISASFAAGGYCPAETFTLEY